MLQGGVDLLPTGFRRGNNRQAQFGWEILQHARQSIFSRTGRCVRKQRVVKQLETVIDRSRQGVIPCLASGVQFCT